MQLQTQLMKRPGGEGGGSLGGGGEHRAHDIVNTTTRINLTASESAPLPLFDQILFIIPAGPGSD